MAKQNGKIKQIGLIVAFLALFAGIAGTWAVYGKDIEDNAGAVEKLEIKGCDPARKHTTEIAVLEERFDNYHTEQRVANEEILEILKTIPKIE